MDGDRLSGKWLKTGDGSRMKCTSLKVTGKWRLHGIFLIEMISQKRMANALHMNPDLMGASGVNLYTHEGTGRRIRKKGMNMSIKRSGEGTIRSDFLFHKGRRNGTDWGVYPAACFFWNAFYKGKIGSQKASIFMLGSEPCCCGLVFGKYKNP